MNKKFLLLACASTFFAAVNCFSQGVAFDSLKANAGTDKTLIFTPVANYGHKIYGFDAGTRTDLRFAARANTPIWTDIMSITSVGNVGIGVNAPSEKLTLNGNVMIQNGNYFGMGLSDRFTYDSKSQPHYGMQWVTDSWSGAGPSWWVSSYGGLKFFSTGVLRMAINDAGNVGIGNAAPSDKLDVTGIIHSTGKIYNGSAQMNTDGGFELGPIGTGAASTPYIDFHYGPGVAQDYNVRIHNYADNTLAIFAPSSADAILRVVGNIVAKKIRVTQTPWADFVFADSYHLPSLMEVEDYIKTNKHLADIPSATEVEKEGIDVGEMNKKLLQKVEELTLYLIDLKKENDKQQVLIDQLMQMAKQQREKK